MVEGYISMMKYVQKKQVLAHTLVATINPISKDDLVNYILHGLGEGYDAFHTSFHVLSLFQLMFWYVTQRKKSWNFQWRNMFL